MLDNFDYVNDGANECLRFLSVLRDVHPTDLREMFMPLPDEAYGLPYYELFFWLIGHKTYEEMFQAYCRFYGIEACL